MVILLSLALDRQNGWFTRDYQQQAIPRLNESSTSEHGK